MISLNSHSVAAKEAERKRIERQTQEFLAKKGNKITQVTGYVAKTAGSFRTEITMFWESHKNNETTPWGEL